MKNVKTKTRIENLEENFNLFIKKVDDNNQKLSNNIYIDELDEIAEEIIDAKQYLSSFAAGKEKTKKQKFYNQISNFPFVGTLVKKAELSIKEQQIRNDNVKNVLNGIFDNFNIKKERLFELSQIISTLRDNLILQRNELNYFIKELDKIITNPENHIEKLKAMDMSIIAQSQDKIIEEMINNNINFILELMENLIIKISKTIPILKNTLNNSLTITGTINSIKDTIDMMNSVEKLSNDITKQSSESIQELIIDVTKSLSVGTDIQFLEESLQRNQNFQKLLSKERIKYIEKTKENYEKLKEISKNSQKNIDNRIEKEIELIENKGNIND